MYEMEKDEIVMRSESRVGRIKKGERSLGWKTQKLPQEDSEWGVYLGADAYPSVKAREQ